MSGRQDSMTVRISPHAHSQLTTLQDLYGGSFSALVEGMTAQCVRLGQNPLAPTTEDGVAGQLAKMNKRVNQVVAFIQGQEKKKLNPLLEALTSLLQQITQERARTAEHEEILVEYLLTSRVFLELLDDRTFDLLRLPEPQRKQRTDDDAKWFDERRNELLTKLYDATRKASEG